MQIQNGVVEVNPRKMSGTPVFPGTRVPIKNLFDYLEGGDSIERFLDHFPSVKRSQVLAVLEQFRTKGLAEYEVAS